MEPPSIAIDGGNFSFRIDEYKQKVCFQARQICTSPRIIALNLRRQLKFSRNLFEGENFLYPCHCWVLCATKDKDGDFSGSRALCRDLELSFRKVWLRLYTSGADENYSMALKEFVKVECGQDRPPGVGKLSFPHRNALDDTFDATKIFELGRHEMETGL
eukprot:436655-Hanusia_phi.AAC.1